MNNPNFNSLEFEGIKNEAGRNSFYLSAKKWIGSVNAQGLIAKAGHYVGTYTHKNIAFEFGSWLSPEFKFYLIKEFQGLKEDENRQASLDWNLNRTLFVIPLKSAAAISRKFRSDSVSCEINYFGYTQIQGSDLKAVGIRCRIFTCDFT